MPERLPGTAGRANAMRQEYESSPEAPSGRAHDRSGGEDGRLRPSAAATLEVVEKIITSGHGLSLSYLG
jgi:hypothetical protein